MVRSLSAGPPARPPRVPHDRGDGRQTGAGGQASGCGCGCGCLPLITFPLCSICPMLTRAPVSALSGSQVPPVSRARRCFAVLVGSCFSCSLYLGCPQEAPRPASCPSIQLECLGQCFQILLPSLVAIATRRSPQCCDPTACHWILSVLICGCWGPVEHHGACSGRPHGRQLTSLSHLPCTSAGLVGHRRWLQRDSQVLVGACRPPPTGQQRQTFA